MLKKLRVLTICLVIALASAFAFTGCKGEPEVDAKGYDILRMFINGGNSFDGVQKDSVWTAIEDATHVSMRVEGAAHNADYYSTGLNPMINSGDFPDIIFAVPSNAGGAYEKWADPDADILCNLDDLLAERPGEYPYLEKILQSDKYRNIQYGGGAHTLLPLLNTASGWGIYYRTDWLERVGENIPVTIEDFQRVLQKFTEGDPDGNGKNDTFGLSPMSAVFGLNPLYHAFGVQPDYSLDGAGNIQYAYMTEEFKNFLAWMREMYANGYIDPQFNSNINSQDRDKFIEGKTGVLITNAEQHVTWIMNSFEAKNGTGKVAFGKPPIGTEALGKPGTGGFTDWGGWWGGFSILRDCRNKHAAMRFLNYLYSPQGSMLRTYGVENVHYSIDENGKIVPNYENRMKEPEGRFMSSKDENGKVVLSGVYGLGAAFGGMLDWEQFEKDGSCTVLASAEALDLHYADLIRQGMESTALVRSNLANVTDIPGSMVFKTNKVADLSTIYATNCIMGTYNLTTDWNNMIASCKNGGFNDIAKYLSALAKDLGISV